MRRQNRKSQQSGPSMDAALQQREGRPFCAKCQRFVKHKDAVWIGKRQCRCPTCGELLERRVAAPGAAQAEEQRPGEKAG